MATGRRTGRPRKEVKAGPVTSIRLGTCKFRIDAIRKVLMKDGRGVERDRTDVITEWLDERATQTIDAAPPKVRRQIEQLAEQLATQEAAQLHHTTAA